jgi:hypothetical protein
MSLILEKCIKSHDNRPENVVRENGKEYKLINLSGFKIKTVKVDSCLGQGVGEKRCDYLMHVDEKQCKRTIFIELKGGALVDALKQLYSTAIYLKEDFKGCRLDGRIVGKGNVPNFKNIPDYKKLFKLLTTSGGDLKVGTNRFYSEKV